ncbi:MAG: hypothetical protein WC614_08435 [bacterium]
MLKKHIVFIKSNVKVNYIAKDEIYVNETCLGILKGIRLLKAYFNIKKKLPSIVVTLAENRKEYNFTLRNEFGLNIRKTPLTRIAQPKGTHLLLLSPNAYEHDSIYTYKRDEYIRLMIHEVTHIITRIISCGEENMPRWFEEGLSVYLSKQWLYEDEFKELVLREVSTNNIPSLMEIIQNRIYYYSWGWTVVKYIEKFYGKKMILEIIEKCKQYDIFKIIGEESNFLEEKWRKNLKKNIEHLFV